VKLPTTYYLKNDVVALAKSFLGKFLLTNIDGIVTGGIITETEAYNGVIDKASHAYNGLRTNRTEVMYKEGGICYVYLCYGVHYLFNIVTNLKNIPHAVLIRGIYPLIGEKEILRRTGKHRIIYQLTNGPGKLSKALGITTLHNAILLNGSTVWIEDRGISCNIDDITSSNRIGVAYAGEDALLPYRFELNYRNYIN